MKVCLPTLQQRSKFFATSLEKYVFHTKTNRGDSYLSFKSCILDENIEKSKRKSQLVSIFYDKKKKNAFDPQITMSVDIDQYCLRWCKESPSFNHIVFPSRKKRYLCENLFFYYRKTKVTFIPYERSYTDLPLLAYLTIGQQPNEIYLNSNINLRCGNERFILLSHLLQMTLITRKWQPVFTINGRENNW